MLNVEWGCLYMFEGRSGRGWEGGEEGVAVVVVVFLIVSCFIPAISS